MTDPRLALDAIGQLPDDEIDLADAALQLARVDADAADWQVARLHLSELARDAVMLAGTLDCPDLPARAQALAGLLARRHGYHGDTETYDDPANANLIRVIERRQGLPVALGILWLHCAQAAGWDAHGLDVPGHFLIALAGEDAHLPLDVFAGGATVDASALQSPVSALAMDRRAVLLRLQNNIKQRRLAAGDIAGALTCAEDMLRIAPADAPLWRETALINRRLDRVAAALRCFEQFLALVPKGDAAARARAAVDELRARLN